MSQTPQNVYGNVNNTADTYYGTLFSHLSYGMGEAGGATNPSSHPPSAENAAAAAAAAAAMAVAASSGRSVPGVGHTEWPNPMGYVSGGGGFPHLSPSSSSAIGAFSSHFNELSLRQSVPPTNPPCSASSYGAGPISSSLANPALANPDTSALLAAVMAAAAAAYHPMSQAVAAAAVAASASSSNSIPVNNQNALLTNSRPISNYNAMNAMNSMLPQTMFYGDGDGGSKSPQSASALANSNEFIMTNHHHQQQHQHHPVAACWPPSLNPNQYESVLQHLNHNSNYMVDGCWPNVASVTNANNSNTNNNTTNITNKNNSNRRESGSNELMKTASTLNSQNTNNGCHTMYYVPPNMRVSSSCAGILQHHDQMLDNNQNQTIHDTNININNSDFAIQPSGQLVSSTGLAYSQMLPYDHGNNNSQMSDQKALNSIRDVNFGGPQHHGNGDNGTGRPMPNQSYSNHFLASTSGNNSHNNGFGIPPMTRQKTWANVTDQPPKGSGSFVRNFTNQHHHHDQQQQQHHWSNTNRGGIGTGLARSAIKISDQTPNMGHYKATEHYIPNGIQHHHSATSSTPTTTTTTPTVHPNQKHDTHLNHDDNDDLDVHEESKLLHQSLSKVINPSNFNTQLDKARFFVIKSFSEDDIHRSIKYSIWCSTEIGNKKLDMAFVDARNEYPIYLFYSVNGSGHFCGMAKMNSRVDSSARAMIWAQDKWQGKFNVQWIFVKDIPNTALRHIRLETNENKPVTHSRDTTELPLARGKQMMEVFANYSHTLSIFDDFLYYEQREKQEGSRRKDVSTRRS